MGQRMQETFQRQRIQETLYQTGDTGDSLWDSRSRRHSMRQWMQETFYGKADAGDSP